MREQSVCELVRIAEQNDKEGRTTSSRYVTTSMREDIDTTEAYLNSKHISGSTDYMGREKPFMNIVIAARNIWHRATDIDVKHIRIRATKAADEVKTFLATILLQAWMQKVNFGQFLNDWGLTLASHGSAVTKFIEKNGKLHCKVLDWNTILVDAIDFDGNIKVERMWLTPAQLKKNKNYNQELVEKLIENLNPRETVQGQQKDNKSDYILVYEVHGELPLSFLTDDEDDDEEYVQQMHIISFQAKKDSAGKYDEYTLFRGRESKEPNSIAHLIKKDGQTYAGGAVKNLFDAQWMVNHNAKLIKDQLELASKLLFQTADGNFVGQNALTNIENGDILIHTPGQPLTQLSNSPDIAAMQSFQSQWQSIANQINGISEAMLGQNAPSGTAWRQVQALLQESHSLFELMTENKGLALKEMLRTYVLPYFKKQLDNTDEISAILEEHQIKQIDAWYVPNEILRRVNQKKKEAILSGQIYDPAMEAMDTQAATNAIQSELSGNQRFIRPSDIPNETWKEILKDVDLDELEIDVTGETKDVQGALATLTTVLQTIAGNPAMLQDPNVKMVFGKILNLSGNISPLEIQTPAQMPALASAPAPALAIQ